jgi:antagonist of KipI
MGCRLSGIPLQKLDQISLVSSAVTKGTIQLLPNGQLIILGADHQTTGGYPRVAHVISADMHLIAQLQPAKTIRFAWVDVIEAENILMRQHEYLLQLQIACNLRLEEFLTAHDIH